MRKEDGCTRGSLGCGRSQNRGLGSRGAWRSLLARAQGPARGKLSWLGGPDLRRPDVGPGGRLSGQVDLGMVLALNNDGGTRVGGSRIFLLESLGGDNLAETEFTPLLHSSICRTKKSFLVHWKEGVNGVKLHCGR